MPETPTPRLQLRRPLNDGSELVNVQTDLNQNADKLDLAAGFQAVTSTTRPSAPFSGKGIFETNTSNRSYFSNGSAPASGSWVEIPNSSGTFGSTLKLAATAQLTIGADVNIFRNAADVLRTNDSLIVDGATTLTGAVTASNNVTVNGILAAKNRIVGTVSITPTAANIPTSAVITFPAALTGTTFYGQVSAAVNVPGSVVTGVGITAESATGCTIWVTRVNTTSTPIRYVVEGF
ncbi:hypothetical protein ACFCX0_03420 [Streptomyces sp. NPDC056352]|uniref:hypothetical protein n=1 Tax=Streptomyces sp. NPDC056352 TaxID=3345791 RepID=UPI0035E34762